MRLRQITGAGTQRFAYDGLDMIAEYNGADTLQRRYVFGPGIDEPLVWYEGSGTADRRFLHADERGSIVAVSDASGAMLAINKYDEFGTPGSSNSGRFQYTGQMWIGEVDAYYYKARFYSPFAGGRFLQTDPIGYAGGLNLYIYTANDPVSRVDPLGLANCGLENSWRSDNCAEDAVGRELRRLNPGLDTASASFALQNILEYFYGEISYEQLASSFALWDSLSLQRLEGLLSEAVLPSAENANRPEAIGGIVVPGGVSLLAPLPSIRVSGYTQVIAVYRFPGPPGMGRGNVLPIFGSVSLRFSPSGARTTLTGLIGVFNSRTITLPPQTTSITGIPTLNTSPNTGIFFYGIR